MAKKNKQGLTVRRDEDFSQWFTQVIQKAELIEYSPVSGCYILRPNSFFIWEQVQNYFDKLIKDDGVENAYFPLFIPESLLTKEANHVEGFAPEVAWVEKGGDTVLGERLAVRPTSETIMYDSYAKWIRSYKDLPLRLNQWCNVVRWEFKHCTPFLRSREFLWQEGHTAFATKKEAQEEVTRILDFYEQTFEELYAVPVLKGQKSEKEKFAGADYSLSVEAFLPNGKAIQAGTSHHLGQNFAKAFEISFTGEDQQEHLAFQNSWGISTRSIGMMIMQHSDDKGLVLPPKVAKTQVVIVPILFDDSREKVLAAAQKISDQLAARGIRVHVDSRTDYSPGWKFNEWELKGVPIRIELGPRDLENNEVLLSRRDIAEKQALPLLAIAKEVELVLEQIHQDLLAKAKEFLQHSIVKTTELSTAKEVVLTQQQIALVPFCNEPSCEAEFKEETLAKSLNAPLEQPELKADQQCFNCSKAAAKWFYFAKSY